MKAYPINAVFELKELLISQEDYQVKIQVAMSKYVIRNNPSEFMNTSSLTIQLEK